MATIGLIGAVIVLTVLLPDDIRLGPHWVLPAIEGLLLVAVIAVDPRSVTRRSREVRVRASAPRCDPPVRPRR